MMLIVFLLVVGFLTYWLIRHPLKSIKFIFSVAGLLLLGIIATFVFGYIVWGLAMGFPTISEMTTFWTS